MASFGKRARLFRLADTGVVLEFDLFGMETTFYKLSDIDMPNDGVRVATLRRHRELDERA